MKILFFSLLFCLLSCSACSQSPKISLPPEYFGDWCFINYWKPAVKGGPYFWGKVSIQKERMRLLEGEVSKDSGHQTIEGKYLILSGEGTMSNPYKIEFKVTVNTVSQTVSYRKPLYKKGDVMRGRLKFLDNNIMTLSVDRIGEMIVQKNEICQNQFPGKDFASWPTIHKDSTASCGPFKSIRKIDASSPMILNLRSNAQEQGEDYLFFKEGEFYTEDFSYLGKIKNSSGKTIFHVALLETTWGCSHRLTKRLLFFSDKNNFLGHYALQTQSPTGITKEKFILFPENNDIDFSKGLPKPFLLINGKIHEFDEASKN